VTEPFDIARDHRFAPTRWFEDFKVGEKFWIPSRTQTDALFAAFQLASGDNDPIHYDAEYCKRRGHPGMLAHGLQVMIQTAAGAGVFPHLVGDSLVERMAKLWEIEYAKQVDSTAKAMRDEEALWWQDDSSKLLTNDPASWKSMVDAMSRAGLIKSGTPTQFYTDAITARL
jgi:hypothetical protein